MEQMILVEKSDFRQHETTFYNAYKYIEKVIPFNDVWDVNDIYDDDKMKDIKLKNGEFAKSWDAHTNRLFVFLGTGFGIICIYEYHGYDPDMSIEYTAFNPVVPATIKTILNVFSAPWWYHSVSVDEQIQKILGKWSPFSEGQNLHRGTDNISDWLEYMNGMFHNYYVPKNKY